MPTQAGNQQRIIVTGQGIDNKIFVRRIIIGAGSAVQAAANTATPAQEWEGFRTVAGNFRKWNSFIRGMNHLTTVMFTNLQSVIFGRKTVILIAIGQFASKRRKFIFNAITTICLIPGKYFAYWLNREFW